VKATFAITILFAHCTSYGKFWDVATPITTIVCPTNFLRLPANSTVGLTSEACIAKYEMKCAADTTGLVCSGLPVSQAANRPWTMVSQTSAKTICSSLGTSYHLMTNSESMALGRNLENMNSNWSGAAVNTGALNRGHSDNSPAASLPAATDADACNGTGQTCSDASWALQRRTHMLSTGAIIWDFTGNVTEWIDWQVATSQKGYASIDGAPVANWREWTQIDSNIALGSTMEPKVWQAQGTALTSTNGIGQYFSGSANPAAANRGGAFNDASAAGVYSLNLNETPSAQYQTVGFRCAYVP